MTNPDSDQNFGSKPDKNEPLTFEQAQHIIEKDLPEDKDEKPKVMQARRALTTGLIYARLVMDGVEKPNSPEEIELGRPKVSLPITEWLRYWIGAHVDLTTIHQRPNVDIVELLGKPPIYTPSKPPR